MDSFDLPVSLEALRLDPLAPGRVGASRPSASAAGEERATSLLEQAKKFEGVFLHALLRELIEPKERGAGLLGTGPGTDVLYGLLEENLAREIAESGGLGLSKTLAEKLDASRLSSAMEPAVSTPHEEETLTGKEGVLP